MQVVVARRWDQLGGRLAAMANARSLADRLGLEFRFVWPRGLDPAVNRPRELFDDAFLATAELGADALDGRPRVYHRATSELVESPMLGTVTTPDTAHTLRALASAGADAFLEVDEIFEIIAGAEETDEVALDRFRRGFADLGWNPTVRGLIESCSAWPGESSVAAIHVRAGDIVTGAWRHGVTHQKYTPSAYVHHAIDRLAAGGKRQVLVMSDNAAYLEWLRGRFPAIVTSGQVLPRYADLTELQRALADILLLARCATIIGPPRSAFSILGAYLGPGAIIRADELVPAGSERDVLLAGVSSRAEEADRSSLWAGLSARDICWCLDVFGDTLSLPQRLALSEQAARHEPEFTAALTHLARNQALAGEDERALDSAARAVAAAGAAERFEDPMFDALATQVSVGCLASIRSGGLAGRWQRDRTAVDGDADIAASYGRCRELSPTFIHADDVLGPVGRIVAVASEVADRPPRARRLVARRLRSSAGQALGPERSAGECLERHRAAVNFDPLSGAFESILIQLERAAAAIGPDRSEV